MKCCITIAVVMTFFAGKGYAQPSFDRQVIAVGKSRTFRNQCRYHWPA
jgi:hypothetical protein